jgi:Fe-S cluster assembly iron-binding protein IscA
MSPPSSRHDRFLAWLAESLDDVERGVAVYENISITRETVVRQFHIAFSCVVFTSKIPSRILVAGRDAIVIEAVLYSLCSLVFGWWGFPWGPFFTIESVVGNILGGHRQTVGDLCNQLTGHRRNVVTLTESAADHARRQIAERGFPPETALYIRTTDDFHPQIKIEYDLPESDGRQWRSESQGLTVLLDKDKTHHLDGVVIDSENGQFVFHKNGEPLKL